MHEAHRRVAYWLELAPGYRACIIRVLQFDILTEVESLWRIEDSAENFLEFLIRDLSIMIDVKSVEDFIELGLAHNEPPMVTEVFHFPSLNLTRFAQVKILKGALQGLPLEFELFNQQFYNLLSCHFTKFFVILLNRVVMLFDHSFKGWVLL